MTTPVFDGYFADPFILRTRGGYIAYGTRPSTEARAFAALSSPDLVHWTDHGGVLERLPAAMGDEYWAPEVAIAAGQYWMYYSVGHGIAGHHLRVARADNPLGPFVDEGVNLTPDETFAIDPHPFQDINGDWYLFFARDVLVHARAGTHLAAAPMATMRHLSGAPGVVLEANADWQMYERNRPMYGSTYNWHTLEGPSVIRRHGRYWLTYSGGAWTGPGYAVSWAVSDKPLGPWTHASLESDPLLATVPGQLLGPGHNSLTVDTHGEDAIAYHAWDQSGTTRQLHINQITFTPQRPRIGGPIHGS